MYGDYKLKAFMGMLFWMVLLLAFTLGSEGKMGDNMDTLSKVQII